MRPHPDDLYGLFIFQYLIHETVLNIYSAGICTTQITHQFFEGRKGLKRVFFNNIQ